MIKLRAESAETVERLGKAGINETELLSSYGAAIKGRSSTALGKSILSNGKKFVGSFGERNVGGFSVKLSPSSFESPLAVSLFSPNGRHLFSAKLGFGQGAVIVEAFHGAPVPDSRSPQAALVTRWVKGKHGSVRQFDVPVNKGLVEFKQLTAVPAPNYLMREIEKTASQNGYREIRIRRPETLFWYRYYKGKGNMEELLGRMRRLYYGVAAAEHYRKTDEYLVKKL